MLRNPAGTGGAREPKHDASTLRVWQGQPLDGQRLAVRHVVSGPGRIVRRSAISWPGTVAAFRRESLPVVLPTASPRPMLVAIAPLGEMVMENNTMREQRQAMLLLIVQTRIKRRRRVRDRLQILAPRHCVFAAVPQPVNETCGLGLVLEFFTPLQGVLRGGSQRGLTAGQSFSWSGANFKPAWRAAMRASRKAARSAGEKTCCSVWGGTLAGGCCAWLLKAPNATPEPTTAIIVKAAGKPGFMGILRFGYCMIREYGFDSRATMSICTTEAIDKGAEGFK